jgi:hypothetical protein
MNTKNYFTFEAVICLLFGITLTFTPDYLGREYFTDPTWINNGTKLVAQGYGTLLLACAVANWSCRNAELSVGRRALLLLAVVSNVLLLIVHPMAIMSNIETAFTWGTVLICLISAIWGGMLLMKEKV